MKLLDIVDNLDRSKENEQYVGLEDLVTELNLTCYGVYQSSENPRLTSYWLAKHICTDTHVGLRAYFLDDLLVAVSSQAARKSDENFEWVSLESARLVQSYILSLEEEEVLSVDIADFDEEMGDGYPVEYVGQLLTNKVLYEGALVEVTKEDSQGYKNFHTITIKTADDTERDIDIRDTLSPWKIKKEEE